MANEGKSRFQIFKEIWTGSYFPGERQKYTLISVALGFIHILLTAYFFAIGYGIIAVYNIFSAVYYLTAAVSMSNNKKFFGIFIGSYIEIVFFSFFVSLLCGWDFGFALFMIALAPVSFFTCYTASSNNKRNLTLPTIFTFMTLFFFLATKLLCDRYAPLYPKNVSPVMKAIAYYFNVAVTFYSTFVFAVFFSLDIGKKEKELEKQNKALADISSIDPLTKLFNRRKMGTFLDEAVAKVKETGDLFTVTIGDIDNFKMINDIHGHNIGDEILSLVARTMKETLPDDAIICRWGGEEFLILIKKPEIDTVPIIEALRYAISQVSIPVSKPTGTVDIGVTMTFGVNQYVHGFTIEKVISLADEHLYYGKSNGKNRVVSSKNEI
ncbi:MAG: GGDEF domain-containing protein [Lachnospiraceae bacterium]|nr:GGDEF domain-containing protein [Lachnospiraceae bacterium]